MARKAANGTGTIGKCKDGRWYFKIMVGYKSSGKPDIHDKRFQTYEEVIAYQKKYVAENLLGTFVKPNKKLYFSAYITQWLTAKKNSVTNKTYIDKYKPMSERISKGLGSVPIQQLSRKNIQDFINEQSAKLSARYIADIHMAINNALELALADGAIKRNPCTLIELPKIIKKKLRLLTEPEVTAILTQCYNTRIYDVAFLILSSGLTRGEALGLEWNDVDLDNGTIHVTKTWIAVHGKPEWSEVGTKTEAREGYVGLLSETVEFLKKRKEAHPGDKYVFPNKKGQPMNPNNFYRDFRAYCKDVGIDIGVHDLRHNYATKLMAAGVHQRIIQEQLRHKDLRATAIYTHAAVEMRRAALAATTNALLVSDKLVTDKKKTPRVKPAKP